jgi:hypothetical protein
MTLRKISILVSCFLFLVLFSRADSRNWQNGMLTATEKLQVPSGTTDFTSIDGSQKKNGDFSGDSTKTKSQATTLTRFSPFRAATWFTLSPL